MKILLAVILLLPSGAASAASLEDLKADSGSRFAEARGSETDRAINEAIDASSRPLFDAVAGGDGAALQKEVRRGEAELLRKTIEESPMLKQAFIDAQRNRTWHDAYEDRRMDAAVASWRSSMLAGYIWGTAPAYATFETAPPVVNVVGGAVLWLGGVVVGAGAGLLQSALTGHL